MGNFNVNDNSVFWNKSFSLKIDFIEQSNNFRGTMYLRSDLNFDGNDRFVYYNNLKLEAVPKNNFFVSLDHYLHLHKN